MGMEMIRRGAGEGAGDRAARFQLAVTRSHEAGEVAMIAGRGRSRWEGESQPSGNCQLPSRARAISIPSWSTEAWKEGSGAVSPTFSSLRTRLLIDTLNQAMQPTSYRLSRSGLPKIASH